MAFCSFWLICSVEDLRSKIYASIHSISMIDLWLFYLSECECFLSKLRLNFSSLTFNLSVFLFKIGIYCIWPETTSVNFHICDLTVWNRYRVFLLITIVYFPSSLFEVITSLIWDFQIGVCEPISVVVGIWRIFTYIIDLCLIESLVGF